jgi:hypothetical protein
MFVKHEVKNFGNWKRVYDNFAATRKELGVTGAGVYRSTNDPKQLTVTHQFKDLKTARAFADSDELKSTMHDAGVAGQPDIWFTEDIEQTAY